MSLRISGKHMDIGDAFRIRIEERIGEIVGKYFDGGYSGHVTVVKSGSRFSADCMLHLDSGAALQATGEAQDPQLAFDAAADRIETRLRRYKRRLKSHQVANNNSAYDDVIYRVMSPAPEEEDDDDAEVIKDYAPTIVAETSVSLRTMSVASAVVELDLKDSPVLVFRNAGNDQVNIVYRRADGNIGWIDPSAVKGQKVSGS
ncbi:ribosome hibernation-promoting factor, HPF/YfiA family [Phyllobacterium leguminum]|uniref:Ribosome hibernation promoting factor n=1 Tax=Phyllobacterium leguminum TaxID=314237 RepID=A0A318T9Q6_9HYPH|nr:ribosome-associated translation inhibitor RaiA [Phyllobacterium leguminum]PYE87458.1 SSU ribosomal protein S30P /sigma 54 modulation protein [Phyllobacterium leguminum]